MAGPGVGHFYLPYILYFWYEIVCFQPQPEKLLPQINEPSSATKSPYSYQLKAWPKESERQSMKGNDGSNKKLALLLEYSAREKLCKCRGSLSYLRSPSRRNNPALHFILLYVRASFVIRNGYMMCAFSFVYMHLQLVLFDFFFRICGHISSQC